MKLKLIRKDQSNSYYELPDDLKQKILNFKKPDTTILNDGFIGKGKLTFQRVLANGKFLYENEEGDLITIAKDRAEKIAADNVKNEVKEKFNTLATKFLNEHILPRKMGYAFALRAVKNQIHTIRFSGRWGYDHFGVSVAEGYAGNYSINTEGELEILNYGIDFEKVPTDQEVFTFQSAVDATMKEIDSFINIKKDARGYYHIETERGKFLLVPFEGKREYSNEVTCGFNIITNVRDNIYYNSGQSRNKITIKAKDMKPATNEELKQDLLNKINTFFKDKEQYENIHCRPNE